MYVFNYSSDEERVDDVVKDCTPVSPPQGDPLKTVRALSRAKEYYGDVEWEKMSSTDKTIALKQFLS